MYRTLSTAFRTTRPQLNQFRPLYTTTPVWSSSKDMEPEYAESLDDKRTRENIRSALSSRAADAIRYDYFAQRAELEAETEAATLFRSLTETAKQQAMGYMELLEEYGDADFGSTMINVEVSAQNERNNADEVLRHGATVAGEEALEHVQEFFEDMADAADKAAMRLEVAAQMLDLEGLDGEEIEEVETQK